MTYSRHPWKPWLPEEDSRLKEIIAEKNPVGDAEWAVVAEQFHERTMQSLRQRRYALRNMEAGTEPRKRVRRTRGTLKSEKRLVMQEPIDTASLPQHTSLTALVFKDPLPGRSALDRRDAGASA